MTGARHRGAYDAPLTGQSAAADASDRLKQQAYAAVNRFHVEALAAADSRLKAAPAGDPAAVRDRDRTYALAGDALAEGYRLAEQQHFDRLAAVSRHFGNPVNPRGNPDAPHSVDFLSSLCIIPQPAVAPALPLPTTAISYDGTVSRRRVHTGADGRVTVIDEPKFDDAPRGTFTGSAEDFMAAKVRATMTPAEIAVIDAAKPDYIHTAPDWAKTKH